MQPIPTFTPDSGVRFELGSPALSPLEEAVYLSLFTNARVAGQGGWWGDAVSPVEGVAIGSTLYTLWREKQTPDVLERAKRACEESLRWLVEGGYVQAFSVATRTPQQGWLLIELALTLPSGEPHALTLVL